MEAELYWEVETKLGKEDEEKLESVITSLPGLIEKNSFLRTLNISQPAQLNIIIIDDSRMRELNSEYRDKDKPTDVLTFSFESTDDFPGGMNIAEIYISQDTALRQSREQKLSLFEEFVILIVHGFLHAFNYDHEISIEAGEEMSRYEKIVLEQLGSGHINPLTD